MSRINKQNIDQKTNKPNVQRTEGITADTILNRAEQTRRDDDVIRTPKRTLYDIDYAIKWYIENQIQPQLNTNNEQLNIPVIYANGEKWDNVRRLGYLRDEKGMLQSPMIMLKRNSVSERDNVKTLDVNRNPAANHLMYYKPKFNSRNQYIDQVVASVNNQPAQSNSIYLINVPKYVTIEYDMMLWCDFTTQLNEVVDQILPHGRLAWGDGPNKFPTSIGSVNFEIVNTVGEDRIVRATIPITVIGTLLPDSEARISTLKKMYSVKKLVFDINITVDQNIFNSTIVPFNILQAQQYISSGGTATLSGASSGTLNAAAMLYLTNLTDKIATFSTSNSITLPHQIAYNPITAGLATKNEFNVYINGQYIDKDLYTWTPSNTTTQSIVFDTSILGYIIEATDTIIVNGRWA